MLLSLTTYVGAGFFFGARFARRAEDVNGPVAAFGVPLLVLGGTFFPPAMLPPFLLSLTQFNPIYHMNEALKPVSALGAEAGDIATHLVALAVFAVAGLVLGTRAYRSMMERERRAA